MTPQATLVASKLTNSKQKKLETATTEIIFKKVGLDELQDYINTKNAGTNNYYSLNDFLQEKFENSKKKTLIIANLSNQKIGNKNSEQLLDLKGAIFTGSLIENTIFHSCDLESARFCDMHLKNVEFINSNINFVDFRRADLNSCKFGDNYRQSPWNLTEGIKLSSTASCIRIYADIKNEIAKKNEQKRLIENKRLELRELRNQTPLLSQFAVLFSLGQISLKYKKLRRELYKMQKGIFYTNHMIHTSFQNVFRSESCVFDPILLKEEENFDKIITKKFMPISRQNLMDYLKKIKKSKNLSLNEFASELYLETHPHHNKNDKNIRIIADLSSKINVFGNNEWNRIDLSDIDFSNTDLSEVVFAGSNLRKCNFKGANLSRANFESTLLQESIFDNSILTNSNFYYADLSNSHFTNSDMTRARLDWSTADSAILSTVNLQRTRAPNAHWRNVKITNSNMDYSDFSGTDFRSSNFTNNSCFHSLFERGYFREANFTDCNFNNSIFNHANLVHSIWDKCNARRVEMMHSDLSEIKISESCNFEKSNFSYSKLNSIKAPRAHFVNTIMNHVKINEGNLAASNLNGAIIRFAHLENCIFNESNCANVDFTGSKFDNIRMMKSNLNDAIFASCLVHESQFNKTNFENADFRNSKFKNSILDGINGNRIKVNHNTKIQECSFKDLDGQLYHYDEDNFMDIIFIEQVIANTEKSIRAEFLYKLGPFAFILRLTRSKYKISKDVVKRLHNFTLSNQKENKKRIKKLLAEKTPTKDAHKFKFVNLLK
jgi:uncharacterized protein YjbI with pentapeptide repeats